jgi:hypothetical protein
MSASDQLVEIWGNVRGLTLNDLLQAWNELRNAVMGRGIAKPPNVSQRLYDATGEEYLAFRKWLSEKPALVQVMFEITGAPDYIERYRLVFEMARREGINVKPPPHMPGAETLIELLQQAPLTEADLAEQAKAGPPQLLPRALRPTLGSPGFDYGDLLKAVLVGIVSTLAVRVVMKVIR